jgi:hypothetical protein
MKGGNQARGACSFNLLGWENARNEILAGRATH